jgi:hypothetical protein
METAMLTNAQMEANDAFEAARIRIKLIREGILDPVGDRNSSRLHTIPRSKAWGSEEQGGSGKGPDFHIPATRHNRLATARGVTSFHFGHSSVAKVTYTTKIDGVDHEPGAAHAHSRYIERESAIADLADRKEQRQGLELDPDHPAAADLDELFPASADDVLFGASPSTPMEHDHVDYLEDTAFAASRSVLAELALLQPDFGGPDPEGSIEDAEPDADMCLLSGRDLVCDVWGAEHLLLSSAEISMEAGHSSDRLRCPAPGDQQPAEGGVDSEQLSLAGEVDSYLIRPSALAVQPDGSRALITNIDEDDNERGQFWKLTEKHERTASPDTITFCASDNPEFWAAVLTQPDCPDEIRAKLEGPDRDSSKALEVNNGKKAEAFLRKQPGWIKPVSKAKRTKAPSEYPPDIARVTRGRGGRVQYRCAFELPQELSPKQNFALLKDFAHEFEKRAMPFVAVMHEPDEHNSDQNWHGHLAYVDRPSRRINQDDITRLADQGFDVSALAPGMWDFAIRLRDPERANRWKSPLRQDKVPEVSGSQDWPKTLRIALAKVTNRHLAAAGVARRVSPETYAEMGIVADPHEHLGTRINALETKGVATPTGIANEEKQWAAIMEQAEAKYQADLQAADALISETLRGLRSDNVQAVARAKLFGALNAAALLRRNAFLLDQEVARAGSRARMVYERNLKLLKASEAGPNKYASKKVAEFRSLVGQASEYLSMLEQRLADVQVLPAQWREVADRCEDRARLMIRQVAQAEKVAAAQPQSVKAPERMAGQHPPALALPSSARPSQPKGIETSQGQPANESRQDAEIRRRIAEIYEKAASGNKAPAPERPPLVKRSPQMPPKGMQPPHFPPPGLDRSW